MTKAARGVVPSPIDDPWSDESTSPFWEAALESRLTAAKCTRCGTCQIPPKPRCYHCQNDRYDWIDLPGTGTIYSFTVVRHALRPDLVAAVPYVTGVIELDGTQGAGARMISNIIDCVPEAVRIGDKVRVVFDKVSDTYVVPRFAPIAGG
jgi:uncharacterized OB-fold protein